MPPEGEVIDEITSVIVMLPLSPVQATNWSGRTSVRRASIFSRPPAKLSAITVNGMPSRAAATWNAAKTADKQAAPTNTRRTVPFLEDAI